MAGVIINKVKRRPVHIIPFMCTREGLSIVEKIVYDRAVSQYSNNTKQRRDNVPVKDEIRDILVY